MKAGDIVPNFILNDEKGNEFELYKHLDTMLLIVFYPKDDTPVCSSQLAEYNNNLDNFIKNGVRIVGISTDSVISHLAFCKRLKLKFPLLSDADKKVSRQFNAINFLGMTKRLLVLIGIDKKVLWIGSTLALTYIKTGEIIKKLNYLTAKK